MCTGVVSLVSKTEDEYATVDFLLHLILASFHEFSWSCSTQDPRIQSRDRSGRRSPSYPNFSNKIPKRKTVIGSKTYPFLSTLNYFDCILVDTIYVDIGLLLSLQFSEYSTLFDRLSLTVQCICCMFSADVSCPGCAL